ncbi:MAG: nitrogen regulation protein NR(II) [Spongiibacteraceae bacterium]|jgi:two-component system nitrogen regulation sensor histidine kinase GlnL|nr:nitrogen regulation protein NR(II) [Spongiibacteraceae bacterium]
MPAESLHHRILDNLTTATLLVEADLSVAYLNPAAEALLEISGSRVLGEAVGRLFIDDGELLPALQDASERAVAFTRREVLLTLPSGQQVTVDFAVTPISESDHHVALVLELQPMDRLLRISREEGIVSTQQTTRALVRNLAHEIKNPLGGLRGAAQLLARELTRVLPEAQLTEYTAIIIEEADRLRNLVDRMLGPHQTPRHDVVNLHEVLERMRQLLQAETGGRIAFRRDYDPSIPDTLGDREQLIQALLNIGSNAVQALTSAQTPSPEIRLRTRVLRQFTIGTRRHRLVVRMDIEDNGPGVPADIARTLFYPMVSGRPDGTGLGLSISQSIINRHAGLIECHSRPGCTVFSIYIPLEPQAHEQDG